MKIKKYNITPEQLIKIIDIEQFQAIWEASKGTKRKTFISNLKKTTIITSSGSSTRIEGAVITDQEIEDLIKKGCKITKVSSRSEREVAGYVKAIEYIYKHYKDLEVSEKNIRDLHALLTSELLSKHLPKKQRGIYKDITNNVVEKDEKTGIEKIWFKTTPAGPQTESEMEQLVSLYKKLATNKTVHPLVLTASFIVHFLAIHPFRDGNGRLSRIITTWLLLRHGYSWAAYSSHEKIIEDNKEMYYVSLRKTQKTIDSKITKYEYWLDYFLTTIMAQVRLLKTQLNQESPSSFLNDNEKKVYDLIQEHGSCSSSFLLTHLNMTENGIRTLLRRLTSSDILEKTGSTKKSTYRIKT